MGPWATSIPLLAALTFAGVRSAEAYVCLRTDEAVTPAEARTGPSLTWSGRGVRFVVTPRFASTLTAQGASLAALGRAAAAWNDVVCSDFVIELGPVVPEARAGNDAGSDQPHVIDRPASWGDRDPRAGALTLHFFDTRSGEILDSDVIVNPGARFVDADAACEPRRFEFDLENTLTHELGHVVGLGHPPVDEEREATMAFDSTPCDVEKRTLAATDEAGICRIYPTGEPTSPCFPPAEAATVDEGGCQEGAGQPSMPVVLVLTAIALALRSRARRGSVLVLALLATSPEVSASTLRSASIEELASTASIVVRGHVAGESSRWVEGEIWSTARVEVTERWKGTTGPVVLVHRRGGTVGTRGMHVTGEASLPVGREVLLFLRPSAQGGGYWVEGMALGALEISGERATRNLSGLRLVGVRAEEGPFDLTELRARVRAALTPTSIP